MKLYWDARVMMMMRQLLHHLCHGNNNNNNFSITLLCYCWRSYTNTPDK